MIIRWFSTNMKLIWILVTQHPYVLSHSDFQNGSLNAKMWITLQDGFSDFSGKHSDILQVFPYKKETIISDVFSEPFLVLAWCFESFMVLKMTKLVTEKSLG